MKPEMVVSQNLVFGPDRRQPYTRPSKHSVRAFASTLHFPRAMYDEYIGQTETINRH